MWVHSTFRRQRVATNILDAVRSTFFFGLVLGHDRVAFSHPTRDGLAFCRQYRSGVPLLYRPKDPERKSDRRLTISPPKAPPEAD